MAVQAEGVSAFLPHGGWKSDNQTLCGTEARVLGLRLCPGSLTEISAVPQGEGFLCSSGEQGREQKRGRSRS